MVSRLTEVKLKLACETLALICTLVVLEFRDQSIVSILSAVALGGMIIFHSQEWARLSSPEVSPPPVLQMNSIEAYALLDQMTADARQRASSGAGRDDQPDLIRLFDKNLPVKKRVSIAVSTILSVAAFSFLFVAPILFTGKGSPRFVIGLMLAASLFLLVRLAKSKGSYRRRWRRGL